MDNDPITVAEKAREERLELEAAEMTKVLGDPATLWFLWRTLEACGLYRSFMELDPEQRAVHSGMREVGLWIIGKLSEHDPQALDRMRLEADRRRALLDLEAILDQEEETEDE